MLCLKEYDSKACLIILSTIVLFLLSVNSVFADSMKCGTRRVKTGDTKTEVLLKCGEPFTQEVVGEKSSYRMFLGLILDSTTVIVEKWTYHLGTGKFLRILTFEGDKLVTIEQGDKP
jgi:hypothetical protein